MFRVERGFLGSGKYSLPPQIVAEAGQRIDSGASFQLAITNTFDNHGLFIWPYFNTVQTELDPPEGETWRFIA